MNINLSRTVLRTAGGESLGRNGVNEGVVSKETVVLRRWGSSTQKFGFINGVDNVNWPPYRDSLYGGQFTLSTPLIKPNFRNGVKTRFMAVR